MDTSNSPCPEGVSSCFLTSDGTNYAHYKNRVKHRGDITTLRSTSKEDCAENC